MRTHRERDWPGVVVVLLLGGACAACRTAEPKLVPASAAQEAPSNPSVAVVNKAGLDLRVGGNEWDSNPEDLSAVMTPVWISIRNGSGQPLRIRYDDFKLSGVAGSELTPIPPYRIDQPGPVKTAVVPGYPWNDFYPAPYLGPYYPGFPTWSAPIGAGPAYRDVVTWQADLPTTSMLAKALPEGVLKPGGDVSGFLYFPKVSADQRTVTFEATLSEPQQGQQVASIEIPFRVKR